MQHATLENFSAAHDALKARTRCTRTNLFQDSHELAAMLAEKHCLLHETEKSLFLLVPYHSAYYDCLFLAADTPALADGVRGLQEAYREPLALRGSCVGREPLAGETAELFRQQGFKLAKKLLRMRFERAPEKILSIMRSYADEYQDCMSFAHPDDAEEILDILKKEFDIVADNLPELEAIRKNILNKGVVILRKDNKIASLKYFQEHKNILHNLYDVTLQEYRREGFFMALSIFVYNYFNAQKKSIRTFGWRDISSQKLIKHAHENNQQPDGIIIYNMLRPSPCA